jgi:hypothetical protein
LSPRNAPKRDRELYRLREKPRLQKPAFLKGTAFRPYMTDLEKYGFTGCGKTQVFEGYGLQAVRNQSGISTALAAEGNLFPSL